MMWYGYYDGWSWLLMAAMMVLFWGGVAALIVFVARSVGPKSGGDRAMDTLRRRLASGEISREEFESTRRSLQG
jgi:putative membrane protein